MNEDVPAWPLPLRLIHWASAALVIAALSVGAYMVQFVQNPAQRFDLTQTHKSIGVTVFALTVVRLCLRVLTIAPRPVALTSRLLLAAKATHISLYALILLLPLSGWLMATTTPIRVPTTVFGLFALPYALAPNALIYSFAQAAHVAAAVSLGLLMILHIAAALVHALWWRDRTMVRMWWNIQFRRASLEPMSNPASLAKSAGKRVSRSTL
jgi:cytochrome b561